MTDQKQLCVSAIRVVSGLLMIMMGILLYSNALNIFLR